MFWAGLIVRLLYLTLAHTYRLKQIDDHLHFGWEMGRIARALATGYGYADPFTGHTGPTAWCPPLYPLLMAAVFKLCGVYTARAAWVILAVNCVFSAATAPAVYEIGRRCYNRRVAVWSGWLWALYPAAMQYAVHWVWDMALTAFLFAWTIVLALRMRGIGDPPSTTSPTLTQTTPRWLLFGLLWGLIALSNSTLLLFLPVCAGWILRGAWPRPGLRVVLARAAMAVCIFAWCLAPWIARNYLVFHALIPMRGNFGAELRESVRERYLGFPWGPSVPPVAVDPTFLRYRRMGEFAYVKQQGAEARLYIAAHKRRFFELALKRIYFYWVSVPHPFEKSVAQEMARELDFCFLSLAGLLGLALSLRHRVPGAAMFLGAFLLLPLPYYFVTVQARFRHPLEPLITVLGVYLFQSATRRGPRTGRPA